MIKTNNKHVFFLASVIGATLFTLYMELHAVNQFLPTLSFILIVTIVTFNLYLNDDDFYSPLSMFSIMYVGYAIGGFYYSGSANYFGKFIEFLNLRPSTVVDLMRVSLIYATICFLCFGFVSPLLRTVTCQSGLTFAALLTAHDPTRVRTFSLDVCVKKISRVGRL